VPEFGAFPAGRLVGRQSRQSSLLCQADARVSCLQTPRPYPQAQAEALQAELRGARVDLHRGALELQVLLNGFMHVTRMSDMSC